MDERWDLRLRRVDRICGRDLFSRPTGLVIIPAEQESDNVTFGEFLPETRDTLIPDSVVDTVVGPYTPSADLGQSVPHRERVDRRDKTVASGLDLVFEKTVSKELGRFIAHCGIAT